jgi:hypothetical protein
MVHKGAGHSSLRRPPPWAGLDGVSDKLASSVSHLYFVGPIGGHWRADLAWARAKVQILQSTPLRGTLISGRELLAST